MIAEVVMALSIAFSFVALYGRSQITRQFGFAFLGLFSSLSVFVSKSNFGVVLLALSAIVLPYVLFRIPEDIEPKKIPYSHSVSMILCIATVVVIGVLDRLDRIQLELAIIASMGIVWILLRRSTQEKIVGLAVLFQAILVEISLVELVL